MASRRNEDRTGQDDEETNASYGSSTSSITIVSEEQSQSQDPENSVNPVLPSMASYAVRLGTFRTWPRYLAQKPVDLAAAGFFYLGTQDHVQCFYCGGQLCSWESHAVPAEAHENWFPHCRYGRDSGGSNGSYTTQQEVVAQASNEDQATTANTSTEGSGRVVTHAPEAPGLNPEGRRRQDGERGGGEKGQNGVTGSEASSATQSAQERQHVTYEDLGLFTQTPKRPDMALVATRLNTFPNWPHERTYPAAELAEAGFYYTGHADLVRCFHCKGGLKNWESSNQPWVEHSRCFPRCHFVHLAKGQKFVDVVQRLNNTRPTISERQVMQEVRRLEEEERKVRPSQESGSTSEVFVRRPQLVWSEGGLRLSRAPVQEETGGGASLPALPVCESSAMPSPSTPVYELSEGGLMATGSGPSVELQDGGAAENGRECVHCQRRPREIRQECGHRTLCDSCYFCRKFWKLHLDEFGCPTCLVCGKTVKGIIVPNYNVLRYGFRFTRLRNRVCGCYHRLG